MIKILALKGAAQARLHKFADAKTALDQAGHQCEISVEPACGDAIRSRGVLANQQGNFPLAMQFFQQTLTFARDHADRFLEATALLNLGAASLKEQHFDEAIARSEQAYKASVALGAGDIAQTALGNLGSAYYNLGDSERSLELSLDAEKHATQLDDIIAELSWITNAGYVYVQKRDFNRAKQSYIRALDLANRNQAKDDIYNALRAMALVSVESGELDEARRYADQAIAMARDDSNRQNELYPLLVRGLIAARIPPGTDAEPILKEVERDPQGNASLRWRAEHALARLYEDEKRAEAADRAYRAALATFEKARSSQKREDTSLPFSANAASIYDDYVHFLVSHGRSDEALRWADNSRARTLAEGLGVLPREASAGPPTLRAQETARKVGGTLLFYWLGEKQSYLWVITKRKTSVFTLAPGSAIAEAVQRYRRAIETGPDVLEAAAEDGRLLYRMLVTPAESLLTKNPRVFILPDGELNNLNFETLLVPAPKLHYWIEDVTITSASSLRLLDASVSGSATTTHPLVRSLLLIGNSLPPNDKYPPLPKAVTQMDAVARHFSGAEWKILTGAEATPQAYLNGHPETFSHIHFVAHGIASQLSPLDSAIVLSKSTADSDSFKLYARDVLQHPLRAELVTVSACYGAEGPSYSGEGLVALSWAFLRAGAHNVVAALWEVTDVSTSQLMDQFYAGIEHGESPGPALRAAKLSLLHGDKYRNAYYWAPFQLYAGSNRFQLKVSSARRTLETKHRPHPEIGVSVNFPSTPSVGHLSNQRLTLAALYNPVTFHARRNRCTLAKCTFSDG